MENKLHTLQDSTMSTLTVMRGDLLPTKTYHTREWTFVAMPCRLHLADGTIAIHQERGRKAETDRYAIQEEQASHGCRVFLLEKLFQQVDTIPSVVSAKSDDGPYQITVRPARGGTFTTHCTCMAAKRSYCCKHAEVIGAIIEDGGLLPADESALTAEMETVQEDTPMATEQPSYSDMHWLPNTMEATY
jgi:hypothetical protein